MPQLRHKYRPVLKVSKSRKQFMASSILPTNKQNSLSWVSSLIRIVSFVRFLEELRHHNLLSRLSDLYLLWAKILSEASYCMFTRFLRNIQRKNMIFCNNSDNFRWNFGVFNSHKKRKKKNLPQFLKNCRIKNTLR